MPAPTDPQSPNAAAAFDQIAVESRESFAGMARTRAAHQEETATGYSQLGQFLQGLFISRAVGMVTGTESPPANVTVQGKDALYYPTQVKPA